MALPALNGLRFGVPKNIVTGLDWFYRFSLRTIRGKKPGNENNAGGRDSN